MRDSTCQKCGRPLREERDVCDYCRKTQQRKKLYCAVTGLFVLLLVGAPFAWREWQLVGLPDVGPPFDLQKYGTVDVPYEQNAFSLYAFVPSMLNGPSDRFEEVLQNGWSEVTPELKAWLAANDNNLQLLKDGSDRPLSVLGQPNEQSFRTFVNVTTHRSLSRLARLKAIQLQHEGQVRQAWEWCRIAFRHSRHVGRLDASINRSVGAALHSNACEAVVKWAGDSSVDAKLRREALRDVINDYKMTEPISTNLRSSYFETLHNINDNLPFRQKDPETAVQFHPSVLYLNHEPAVGARLINLVYANWLSEADVPLYEQSERQGGFLRLFESYDNNGISPQELEQRVKNSVVAFAELPNPGVIDSVHREQARQARLEVVLAALLFHCEHARFPDSPQEFLGGYLSEWPFDPECRVKTPVGYRLNHETGNVVVWTAGYNHIDDGGNILGHPRDDDFDQGIVIEPPK